MRTCVRCKEYYTCPGWFISEELDTGILHACCSEHSKILERDEGRFCKEFIPRGEERLVQKEI